MHGGKELILWGELNGCGVILEDVHAHIRLLHESLRVVFFLPSRSTFVPFDFQLPSAFRSRCDDVGHCVNQSLLHRSPGRITSPMGLLIKFL